MELMEIIENSELEPKNLTVEELFHIVLYELSFSFKAQGTLFLEEMFSIAYDRYENSSDLEIMKLCAEIAKKHNTNAVYVSRAVTYSITSAWNRAKPDLKNELFSSIIDPSVGKPSVQIFLSFMMEFFKL